MGGRRWARRERSGRGVRWEGGHSRGGHWSNPVGARVGRARPGAGPVLTHPLTSECDAEQSRCSGPWARPGGREADRGHLTPARPPPPGSGRTPLPWRPAEGGHSAHQRLCGWVWLSAVAAGATEATGCREGGAENAPLVCSLHLGGGPRGHAPGPSMLADPGAQSRLPASAPPPAGDTPPSTWLWFCPTGGAGTEPAVPAS